MGVVKLETLLLDNTHINGSGLVHLTGMTNLKVLNLVGTKVTDAGVAELEEALPSCGSFGLSSLSPPFLPPVRVRLLAPTPTAGAKSPTNPPTNTRSPTFRNASSKSGQSKGPGKQGI